ncbi:MAG: DUF4421 family protein [Prevotellaceae bacterium]|nr:DUF4421 family protein [Candidatus Minthosoma caballi]
MKRIEKIIGVVALWSVMFLSANAQSSSSAVEMGKKTLKKAQNVADKISKGKFDSTYVALPEYKWMVTVSGNANYSKFRMKVPVPDIVKELKEDFGDLIPSALLDPKVFTYDMDLHSGAQAVAIGVSYGSIKAKYSFNINSGNDQQLTFETLGSKFGGFVDYRRSTKMKGTMYNVLDGFEHGADKILAGEEPTLDDALKGGTNPIGSKYNNYTTLHMQGHYVFNSKHFAYSAARSASRIQKKSAGSFIALADFYYSRAKFSERFIVGTDEKYRTAKLSLGGGYGYNWTPNAGKLLVHASFIPTVSLFSKSRYSTDLTKDPFVDSEDERTPEEIIAENKKDKERVDKMINATPKLTLNCTARLSVTWNIDKHFVLGGYASYMYSNYKNKENYSIKEHYVNGNVYVGYRF